VNVALGLVAFYCVTPGVLSKAMLFKPAKAMSNFSIIFCLFIASLLQKNFIEKDKAIPYKIFMLFWCVSEFSLYWDETVLLLFPATLIIFPGLFKRTTYWVWWCLLPLVYDLLCCLDRQQGMPSARSFYRLIKIYSSECRAFNF